MLNSLANKFLRFIKSRAFYRFILIFFVFESAWIALTAAYPQAFDEQFHFGLIKFYSHYLLPFLSKQPASANQFGAVTRDPSYLYHYLMSFPYRFIEILTKDQAYQIIALRFIDIAMFTYGLVLFRRILLKVKLSKSIANLAIFIFALIPIVPQLAGQINYDDMLIPLVAGTILLSFKLIDQVKTRKLSFKTSLELITLALFTSIVKFAFLPIFLAIVCFFGFYIIRYCRADIKKLWHSFVLDFKKTSLAIRLLLIGLLALGVGMFAQRDLVNLVEYHAINPDCSKVLSIKACNAYYVWSSDFSRHQAVTTNLVSPASRNIITYIAQWFYWMWYRLFFAVNGVTSHYANYPPLPLPSAIALIIAIAGFIAVIKYRRELFRANPYITFLLVACLFYVLALMAQGYSSYQFTAVLENMNGRYLLPILLLAGAIIAKAFSLAFKKYGNLKIVVAVIVVFMFLEGGGVLTYIDRSNSTWYWDNSKAVKANNVAKKITKKIVVSGKETYNTNVWFFN